MTDTAREILCGYTAMVPDGEAATVLAAYDALVAENARLTAELAEARRAHHEAAQAWRQSSRERDEALRVAARLRAALEAIVAGPTNDTLRTVQIARAALSSEGQPRETNPTPDSELWTTAAEHQARQGADEG